MLDSDNQINISRLISCLEVADVYSMEIKKDDPLKGRFLVGRKVIHNRYTDKQKTVVSKEKDADGKMVGPTFRTMKSEIVAW